MTADRTVTHLDDPYGPGAKVIDDAGDAFADD